MKTKYLLMLLAITACCAMAISCTKKASPGVQATPPPEAKPALEKLQAGEEKRKALERELKAMQIGDLAKKLEDDSARDIEPFNSVAFRELSTRGAGAGRELAALVKTANRSSFLALMAVRKLNRDDYNKIPEKTRVAILIDALGTSKYFNTWGLPHLYWEEAANAIVESGRAAIPGLTKLLANKKEAPVWGSEEVAEYKKYNYRVCDYAMALMLEILQKKSEIPVKPQDRDRIIATLGGIKIPPIGPIGPIIIDKIRPGGKPPQ